MPWLTKSRFTSGLQCPKRLWNEVHQPLELPAADSVAFINGREVDRLMQTLQPGAVISRERGMPAAIAETARLMRAPEPPVLYQPAFRAGDLAVIADVLRRSATRATLVEVKSSTSVKPVHIADVGFQTLVLRIAKVPVDRMVLAHVDSKFVLRRPGDYDGLIVEQDVTNEVEAALPEIAESAAGLQGVMASRTRPAIAMGAQCMDPYECPFIERCTRERGPIPEFPVSLLPRGGKTVEALTVAAYTDLQQVPAELLTGELHLRVHQATVSGETYFDATATAALRELTYPMAYLDFETIGLAIPEILGTRPYQQLPFQFSLHIERSATELQHAEFLAIESFGNFEALAQALLAAVPDSGPVFAYNAPFERRVLEDLAERLPGLSAGLRNVAGRLEDLLPITRVAYYHRAMKGSWSLKAVLPTIAPELNYEELEEVQEAGGAQLAFMLLRAGKLAEGRKKQLHSALLKYCERDSWALVVLRRFLCGQSMNAEASAFPQQSMGISGQEEIDRRYGLEPVFEPGGEAGSDALERFVDIECPYCAEHFTARVDLTAGAQDYIEDCQVCCQPITFSLRVTDDGRLSEVSAERVGQ
jgi:Domain of unknown function(DUF2779)/Cysteine-rich CPXCG